MTRPKWIVTKAVGGGFNVSAQAFAYPDRPDIMDGVAHFYNEDEASLAANAVNVLPEVVAALNAHISSLETCLASPTRAKIWREVAEINLKRLRATIAKTETLKIP